ncbi:hypothetical protein Mp_8g15950 [Marchantia polymorpha subsp. ruderalis]|uniref:Uncharacterized protein n=1 Tax=Marchantia polymorpha TaxID=3197 RepID=A0A2R6WKX5_MARPO|nr:hypothetical protein MARPO_0079s0019 [Marchantia polymorpha]BBN20045.1 hypothetical protein Mp_8g15950 [Marchantia polymorpha subsp. ruderalis]|eukprot:PTQ34509.1 hypothetical protein MARPO_0079s0019 [Marchantia polymorpha]
MHSLGRSWDRSGPSTIRDLYTKSSQKYTFFLRFGSSRTICLYIQSLAMEVLKMQDRIFFSRQFTGYGMQLDCQREMASSTAGANHTTMRKV